MCHLSCTCEGLQGAEDACKSAEDAFVTRAFQNWKLATTVLRQHELSAFLIEAVKRVLTLPAATTDIGLAIRCRQFFCNE